MDQQIRAALPKSTVFTHLEPKEDAASYEDQGLERLEAVEQSGTVAH